MFELLWNLNQNRQISNVRADAGRAQSDANEAGRAASELQRRVDSLVLVNMAMWSILEERLGVSEAQLEDRVREIDLRDGKLDGRYAPEGQECPKCGRVMSVRHQRCMYCGEGALKKRVF